MKIVFSHFYPKIFIFFFLFFERQDKHVTKGFNVLVSVIWLYYFPALQTDKLMLKV